MTAPSELFCSEEVVFSAEKLFGDLIPEYDSIKIEKEWKGLWNYVEFPNSGTTKYIKEYPEKEDEIVAKVHFKTNKTFDGDDIYAEPNHLVLELSDGKKYHEKTLGGKLEKIRKTVASLRDEQQEMPCEEEKGGQKPDICNYFDVVIDEIDNLMEEIKRRYPTKYKDKEYVKI